MTLPTSVEPYVEPALDAPYAIPLIGTLLAVGLWLDLRMVFWEYAVALAIGLVVGAAVYRSRSSSLHDEITAIDPSPRLPVFLRFDHRRVVVVGGGAVAATKIPALLAAGADVTVIAPQVSPAIDRARVRVIERAFEPGDLDGAWFVTAAATPHVNRAVGDAADSRGIFVNAVDDPPNATAYLGGTIARGGVTVAFSTGGRAPALAGLLREAFDEIVPADIEQWLTRAHELRQRQKADGVPMSDRRPQLLDTLNEIYERR
jgi:uroporphyrin-III C-methyltransferase/precorrin-2 dehydrogenase/sirohydrochlorin ferrochelatase